MPRLLQYLELKRSDLHRNLRRFSAFFASVALGAQAAFILLKLWNSKAAAAEWEHVSSDASLRKAPDLSLATS
jgi:hypothetical protein